MGIHKYSVVAPVQQCMTQLVGADEPCIDLAQIVSNVDDLTPLADYMGLSREYVSMVLNGHREPAGAENKFRQAVDELISLSLSVQDNTNEVR